MKAANLRVKEALETIGIDFEIQILDKAVRTAKLAAEALDPKVEIIAPWRIEAFRSREPREPPPPPILLPQPPHMYCTENVLNLKVIF